MCLLRVIIFNLGLRLGVSNLLITALLTTAYYAKIVAAREGRMRQVKNISGKCTASDSP